MTRYLTLAFLLLAAPVAAQTGPCPTDTPLVINPTLVCVTTASDYSTSAVTSLTVQFYAPGVNPQTGTPTQTFSLGKPAPNGQGAIWISRAELGAIPIGQQYVGTITATGPAGTSPRSATSNPFMRVGLPLAPTVTFR